MEYGDTGLQSEFCRLLLYFQGRLGPTRMGIAVAFSDSFMPMTSFESISAPDMVTYNVVIIVYINYW